MITFQRFYESAWHHPGVAFVGGAVVLLWALLTRPPQTALWVVLQLLMMLDALGTGSLTPVPQTPFLSWAVPVLFIILGDARFFYLLARARFPLRESLGLALLAALFVPIVSYSLQTGFPLWLPTSRHLFLTYELLFCFVMVTLLRRLRHRPAGSPRREQQALCTFELVQYGLWVVSDLLIFAGRDEGFALRLVPNLLYYVLFVPFAAGQAQRAVR